MQSLPTYYHKYVYFTYKVDFEVIKNNGLSLT